MMSLIYVDRHFARCPSQWHFDTLWILFSFSFSFFNASDMCWSPLCEVSIPMTFWYFMDTFFFFFFFFQCLRYVLIATLRGVHPSDIPLTLPDTCLRISLTRPNPRLLNILFKLKLNSPDLLNVFRPAFQIQIYTHRQVQVTHSA